MELTVTKGNYNRPTGQTNRDDDGPTDLSTDGYGGSKLDLVIP